MKSCIIDTCTEIGEKRKYLFDGEELCNSHYVSFLEFIIDDLNIDVTSQNAKSSFEKLKITLKPIVNKTRSKSSKRSRMRR